MSKKSQPRNCLGGKRKAEGSELYQIGPKFGIIEPLEVPYSLTSAVSWFGLFLPFLTATDLLMFSRGSIAYYPILF